MIDLGLARISRLLQPGVSGVSGAVAESSAPTTTSQPWRAIHVAGTNGKGSVCAYLSAMLHARGLRSGRFTSPHLVDRWDGIVVDERPVTATVFRQAEQTVLQRAATRQIQGLTEFEQLVATAMELFDGAFSGSSSVPVSQLSSTSPPVSSAPNSASSLSASTSSPAPLPASSVPVSTSSPSPAPPVLNSASTSSPSPAPPVPTDVGTVGTVVVECGLGGQGDATTAMPNPRVATVLTAIGLDHQSFLGTSEAAIAANKAAILRPSVPCVVDPINRANSAVRDAIEARARETKSRLFYPAPIQQLDLEPHQRANLACAYAAFRLAVGEDPDSPHDDAFLARIVEGVHWPGRLQTIDLGLLINVPTLPTLLDGAHNAQSAAVLQRYVDVHLRPTSPTGRVVWVLAASHGKDLNGIYAPLLRSSAHDKVAAVRFGPVDGMPWVRPADPLVILDEATRLGIAKEDQLAPASDDIDASLVAALQWAHRHQQTTGDPVVVAGSLYLVSTVLRLSRDR